MNQRRKSMKNNGKARISVILFAILYLIIGLGNLIGGAVAESRFYIFDNILIRIIGAVLIASSIGIFLRKEIARKGIIAALALSVIEIFIGIPRNFNTVEFIIGMIIMLIIYVPGIFFFSRPKNKEYFN
jgi:hypothetical protein